jgi:predicted PurR-regulated permease PerM
MIIEFSMPRVAWASGWNSSRVVRVVFSTRAVLGSAGAVMKKSPIAYQLIEAARIRSARPELGPLEKPRGGMTVLAVSAVVVTALYFARDIFVPLALAILLSFALGPVTILLRKWRFGRVPSVIAAVLLAFAIIFAIGAIFANQVSELSDELPSYQTNLIRKIHSIQDIAAEKHLVGRASVVLKALGNEIENTAATPGSKSPTLRAAGAHARPIPVEIRRPDATPLEIVQDVIQPLLQPLATTGIVVVFVVLFLLQREDLRDRFIRLAGAGDIRRTTEALNDASRRLSGYLLTQTMINAMFGLIIGGGLWVIGTPNPLLWGILAMLLRFVPYLGAPIAAIFPVALALAVDPGWSMLFWTAALFLTVEPIIGQVVEPLVYGHSTGLSAVAIVVAAAFWTWLWGPVGLLLSTPLTLCLVVLGRHVAHLEFLDIVLGDQPALTLEENFYQRMLAGDPDEAAYQAEVYLKEKSLADYYDEVAIWGLELAQLDSERGELDQKRRVRIKEAVEGLLDNLADHAIGPKATAETGGGAPAYTPTSEAPVLCIAGRGPLDEAAAAMLAQLLDKQGIGGRVVPSDEVCAAHLFRLDVKGVKIVCLSYLDANDFANARYLVRRLRRRLPQARIVVGFWTVSPEETDARGALKETGADAIVTSLRHAVDRIGALAREGAGETHAPLPPAVMEISLRAT